jgi:hypothetical protein
LSCGRIAEHVRERQPSKPLIALLKQAGIKHPMGQKTSTNRPASITRGQFKYSIADMNDTIERFSERLTDTANHLWRTRNGLRTSLFNKKT